jgi:hypothetical protein
VCRNIRVLSHFEPPTTPDEIRAAALQYVRKVTGVRAPSVKDEAVFQQAIDAVAEATTKVLAGMSPPRGPARTRDGERERARRKWDTDEQIDGHYVGTRFVGLVVPSGARYVGGKNETRIRASSRSTLLAIARVWVPLLALAWPAFFGFTKLAFVEAAVLAGVGLLLHRPIELAEDEKKKLRILGSQTGLRIDPSRLLPATRKAKLDMLDALMTKGGLAADPEWLVQVLDEIPGPALPLVYAYARYAGDDGPWAQCADTIYEWIERTEM